MSLKNSLSLVQEEEDAPAPKGSKGSKGKKPVAKKVITRLSVLPTVD